MDERILEILSINQKFEYIIKGMALMSKIELIPNHVHFIEAHERFEMSNVNGELDVYFRIDCDHPSFKCDKLNGKISHGTSVDVILQFKPRVSVIFVE